MHYRCVTADLSGKKLEILREAADESELTASFGGGRFLISAKPVEESRLHTAKRRFNRDTILEFTGIMGVLLQAGLTIQDALEICGGISSNPKTAGLSRGLLRELARGVPFHRALALYAPSFSPLYQSLIRLGEKTGSAAAAFSRMGRYLLAEKNIRAKIGGVLWYPLCVLCTAAAGCLGIIVYIMPRMSEIFSAFNGGGTAVSPEIARVYRTLWISLGFLLALGGGGVSLFWGRRISERFALTLDGLLLRLPLLGPFIKAAQTLDFSFAVEMLTGAGITVSGAIRESASAAGNRAFKKAILDIYGRLLRGEKLSAAFTAHPVFPEYVGTWIAVGERTGSVELVFTQIREYFQHDLDQGSQRLIAMIEPGLILAVGLVVLILILQFVVPIFSLYGRIL
jgi:type II secretory pathway component PulF